MKILCFSDSHNNTYFMKSALSMHKDAEIVIFLGDGLRDIDDIYLDYPDKKFLAVRGNCDLKNTAFGTEIKKTDYIEIEGKRIIFTHGDLYGAKYGTAGLEKLAEQTAADVVLFGHTHIPESIYCPKKEEPADENYPSAEKAYYLFNPGSIGSSSPSYGIITLGYGEPLFSHGTFL